MPACQRWHLDKEQSLCYFFSPVGCAGVAAGVSVAVLGAAVSVCSITFDSLCPPPIPGKLKLDNKIKTIKAKKFNQLRRIICQDNEISAKSMIELFKAVQHVEKPGGAVAEVSYDTEEDLNEVPQEAVDIAKSKNWRLIKTTREGEIEY